MSIYNKKIRHQCLLEISMTIKESCNLIRFFKNGGWRDISSCVLWHRQYNLFRWFLSLCILNLGSNSFIYLFISHALCIIMWNHLNKLYLYFSHDEISCYLPLHGGKTDGSSLLKRSFSAVSCVFTVHYWWQHQNIYKYNNIF